MVQNGSPPSAPGTGLSLYASLLNPAQGSSAPGTITAAPVVYSSADGTTDCEAAARSTISSASLKFQPTKRPQLQTQKPKGKPASSVPGAPPKLAKPPSVPSKCSIPTEENGTKSTLADWTAEKEEEYYPGEKRERGGKKAKKKRAKAQAAARDAAPRDWDDIYDLSLPTQYDEYKDSDEQYRARREWKDCLYAHRRRRQRKEDGDDRQGSMTKAQHNLGSFAPPLSCDLVEKTSPPPPPPSIAVDATGEDAFARRMQMTQDQQPSFNAIPPRPPSSIEGAPVPQLPAIGPSRSPTQRSETRPPPPLSTSSFAASSATISRAPVRYNLPNPPPRHASSPESSPPPPPPPPSSSPPPPLQPSAKPPSIGERYLAKYGWKPGQGLGANNEGIVDPLSVVIEKQPRSRGKAGKQDSRGGRPGNQLIGKIIGGKRAKDDEPDEFGKLSEVVVFRGMVAGLDVEREMREGDLMMNLGRAVEKYGRVERVFIDQYAEGEVPVFVKFTQQVSALNAVNALEGWKFNGNPVQARFYDAKKFANGIYE
ncbi:MAG: hypothetical protein M1822_001430 [Bathelium mastoideum]|nr:MAG: hypothetical protein M1822_001430 [Bathelium mastoideum]